MTESAIQNLDAVVGTLHAAADYSTKRYYAMKFNATALQFALCTAAGERVDGILQDKPSAAGTAGQLQTRGIAPAIYGGTVTKGDLLTTDSSGRLVTSTGLQDFICGIALSDGAINEVGSVFLTPLGVLAPFSFAFPILLATIADGDLVTGFTPGFKGEIMGFKAVVTAAATTAAKASTLNIEIGTTNLTGGSLALTSANMTPLGAVVAATAITAANAFVAASTISIEAASTTAFVEGSIVLQVTGRTLPA